MTDILLRLTVSHTALKSDIYFRLRHSGDLDTEPHENAIWMYLATLVLRVSAC